MPPWGSKFFQFHAVFGKIWQNRMLAPPRELAPPSRGNPRSTTGYPPRAEPPGSRPPQTRHPPLEQSMLGDTVNEWAVHCTGTQSCAALNVVLNVFTEQKSRKISRSFPISITIAHLFHKETALKSKFLHISFYQNVASSQI